MPQLDQDEIDKMIGFNTSFIPAMQPVQNTTKRDNSAPVFRQYQQTYPIKYYNQKEPTYIGVITTIERWNPKTSQWEYYTSSQKLHYPNGNPVGLY
jgi:hypothetical protein